MSLDSIVIDNTVFNFFLKIEDLDLSHILRNILTGSVLVPSEIVNEMSKMKFRHPEHIPKLESWKSQIESNYFFKHCHSFDSIVLEFAKKNIDKGEAEAISQCIKRRVPHFITDDTKCIPFIIKNYVDIRINSSFFLIAIGDISGYIKDFEKTVYEYHRLMRYGKMNARKKNTYQKKIESEYRQALRLYSLPNNEELISNNTNIERLVRKYSKGKAD